MRMYAFPMTRTYVAPEAPIKPAYKPLEEARFRGLLAAGLQAAQEFNVVEAEEAVHVQVFVTEDEEYEVRDIIQDFVAQVEAQWAGTIPASHLA
jgi:hypothetical protein